MKPQKCNRDAEALGAAMGLGLGMLVLMGLGTGHPLDSLPAFVEFASLLAGALLLFLGVAGAALALWARDSGRRSGYRATGGECEAVSVNVLVLALSLGALGAGACLGLFGRMALRGSVWARLALEMTYWVGAAGWIVLAIWNLRGGTHKCSQGPFDRTDVLWKWGLWIVPTLLLGGCGGILRWGG